MGAITEREGRMEYRRLGSAGLKVSALSYGAWVSFGTQLGVPEAVSCMQAAWDAGVNFFDNAEAYGGGRAEEIMGEALRQLGWRARQLRRLDEDLLGHPRRSEREGHAQPQVPP
jgi:diketogulonate reductase-like aldo/keto reductase